MQSILGEQYETLPANSNGNKCCFEYMDDVPNDAKYDSIVVDEAQDFDIEMGLAIRSLLINDSDSSFYVFYDKNQNVFEMDFENAFAIDAPPYVLRYNIRNTGSIYQCAVERTNLGHDTVANSIVGVHPEIHNYNKPSQAVKALSLIVNRLVQKEFVPANRLLSSQMCLMQILSSQENSVLVHITLYLSITRMLQKMKYALRRQKNSKVWNPM